MKHDFTLSIIKLQSSFDPISMVFDFSLIKLRVVRLSSIKAAISDFYGQKFVIKTTIITASEKLASSILQITQLKTECRPTGSL